MDRVGSHALMWSYLCVICVYIVILCFQKEVIVRLIVPKRGYCFQKEVIVFEGGRPEAVKVEREQ